MPRNLAVRTYFGHDLVQPNVCGLQRLVENVLITGSIRKSRLHTAETAWTWASFILEGSYVLAVDLQDRGIPRPGEAVRTTLPCWRTARVFKRGLDRKRLRRCPH